MATYSTIPAAEEPLVAKPQGKSLKALVAGIHAASLFHYFESYVASMASGVDGAAVASFALGALAATAVSASVAAPTTSFIKPMYVFNQKLGVKTFDECEKECKEISGNGFKAGQMTIPCITSFDMNAQLLAWLQGKTGGKDKGVKSFVWIGHKTKENGDDGKWVPKGCDDFQKDQYKGDFICRNGCAFETVNGKPACRGSSWENCDGNDFDSVKGCAVLVNVKTETGAAALNVPSGPITSYEELHSNWIKSADCEFADVPALGPKKSINCICQKTQP